MYTLSLAPSSGLDDHSPARKNIAGGVGDAEP
jgi:hypothetical protein